MKSAFMKIRIDLNVAKVAELMERNVPAHKLLGVAHAIEKLGDLLWDHLSDGKPFRAFAVVETSLAAEGTGQTARQQDTTEQDH
jgi:hypothetical protein